MPTIKDFRKIEYTYETDEIKQMLLEDVARRAGVSIEQVECKLFISTKFEFEVVPLKIKSRVTCSECDARVGQRHKDGCSLRGKPLLDPFTG